MEQIYEQINNLLKDKFPEKEEREKVIADMGELIITETYVEMIESVKDEEKRKSLVDAINAGDEEQILAITEEQGLDLYAMLEAKSKSVMAEVTA